MTRKFHFQPSNTGDLVAVEVNDNENWYFELYQNYSKVGSVVPAIVLNSNDWVEITEKPILVTEDGYEIYSYHTTLKKVAEDFEILYIDPDDTSKNPVFYEVKNAKAYIERHKPRYNIKDLMFLREEIKNAFSWYWTEQEIKDAILKTIIDLKNSKND